MSFQLRGDLERSRQEQQGRSFLVVKDPITRRYFRFTEAQTVILELLEAPIDLETLAARASEKLGSQLSPATMQAFLDSLESKLLLDTPGVREKIGASGKLERPGSSILYWRALSFNPERVFDWLGPRTRWAFTPAFQVAGILLILSGLTIAFTNWDRLWGAGTNLLDIRTLFILWPTVLIVGTYHEFSHGLTCRHFGGRVSEVGFMLIYFSPAFYCDVSDSWMFPSKRNRMLVTLAGGYAQLILWGVCVILWRMTDPGLALNHVLRVVVLFSGLQTLFNFNPLIKLDGYYMLSDYLETPNLRTKAFKSLWDKVAGRAKDRLWRDQRSLMIYAIAAMVFSTSLLVYVYAVLYKWTTSRWALAGLVAFVLFAMLTLRRAAAEPVAGLKALATRAALKKWRNLGIFAALLVASFFFKWELTISAPFTVSAENERVVSAGTDGIIVEVMVRDGERVARDQVLARLSIDFEKQAEIVTVTGELERKRSELALALKGPRPEDVALQKRTAEARRKIYESAGRNEARHNQLRETEKRLDAELAEAQEKLDRVRKLYSMELEARVNVEIAETAVSVARQRVKEIQAEAKALAETETREKERLYQEWAVEEAAVKQVMAGRRPEEIAQLQADVNALEAKLAILKQQEEKQDVRAPIDGIVSTPFPERKESQRVEFGDEVMRLVEPGNLIAEMSVAEKELGEIHMDLKVSMVPSTLAGERVEGRVESIADVARTENGRQVVTVRSKLLSESEAIKPGTTGIAKIYCGRRPIIDLATRRVRLWLNTDLWGLLPW